MKIDNTIYNTVDNIYKEPSNFAQYGWVCSKCGRSWGPTLVGCPVCNGERQTFSWDVTTAKVTEKNRNLDVHLDPNDITTSDFF